MVVKIGGVEIENGSPTEMMIDLTSELKDMGVDSMPELIDWVKDLSIEDRMEFSAISELSVWESVARALKSFFLF
jgi:hypothetical protein